MQNGDRPASKSSTRAVRALLYVNVIPRLGTHLALARAIKDAGHHPVMAVPPELAEKFDSELEGYEDIEVRRLSEDDVKALQDVDVFFCSESAATAAPKGAVTVGIIHSIPDAGLGKDGLFFNGSRIFRVWPVAIRSLDYLAVAVRQEPRHWNERNYAVVKGVYPRELLSDRQSRIGIIPAGYPKLEYSERQLRTAGNLDTIIYSPTSFASQKYRFKQEGRDVVATLLSAFPDFRIVLRPYPHKADIDSAQVVARTFNAEPRFSIDLSPTGLEDQSRCAVCVTDSSSSALTFALSSRRPLVFCNFRAGSASSGTEAGDDLIAMPFGFSVRTPEALVKAVRHGVTETAHWRARISEERDKYIYNAGSAARYLAEHLTAIADREILTDWLAVERTPWNGPIETSAIEAHKSWIAGTWAKEFGVSATEAVLQDMSSLLDR